MSQSLFHRTTNNMEIVAAPSDHNNATTIRHAGRAYVRGRIRRVWRPRYLELTDDGHLQYYEWRSSGAAPEFKYTLVVTAARILDVTTLRDLHTGLPRGSFGFLVRGQRTAAAESTASASVPALLLPSAVDRTTGVGGSFVLAAADDEAQPIRDYLCAVPTLEEAQMWVVALQWAAAQLPSASEHWWKVDYNTTPSFHGIVESKETVAETARKPDALTVPKPDVDTVSGGDTARGKILVTAVTGYSIVRWSTWALEIAYDIHAMLLYPGGGGGGASEEPRAAEHWSLQRTAAQLEQLAAEFQKMVVATGKDDDTALIRRLPRWMHRPALPEVERSLSIVDSLFRSWVLSADLVNTAAFKQFLGLTHDATVVEPKWWQTHNIHPYAIRNKVKTTVPLPMTADVYVREWLLEVRNKRQSNTTSPPFVSRFMTQGRSEWMVQWRHHQWRNMYWMGGAAVAVFGILPAAYPLWRSLMPVVPLRLDYLFASWLGASLIGHHIGTTTQKSLLIAADSKAQSKIPTIRGSRSAGALISCGVKTAPRPPKNKLPTTVSSVPDTNDSPPVEPDSPKASSQDDSAVIVVDDLDSFVAGRGENDDFADFLSTDSHLPSHEEDESDGEQDNFPAEDAFVPSGGSDELLSSPLPKYPGNNGFSCWSQPHHNLFHVRGATYLADKIKVLSGPAPLTCRGVDVWITDNPERHVARHPAVLGGKLGEEHTFLVNFLLPFGNFVAYFAIPPLSAFPEKLRGVWTKFLKGDQQYRDARLKLLPVVVDGPWIVKTAVGPGKSPALLGKAIPLQYFFSDPEPKKKGVYEVDVIITASSIAKGILSVVKSQTKSVSIAFAFIIEAAEQSELPETVLCSFQVHSLHLEDCPLLPECNLDGV